MFNQISKIASAVKNDIIAGLSGYHANLSISIEQLEQDIIDERLQVLKEYSLKGILPVKDLYISINCIPVDCKNIDRCPCNNNEGTPTAHFEIPQIMNDYGSLSIDYIGSTDKQNPFVFYTSPQAFRYRKYRKRGKRKPYVWVDTTPNENGMYDCFIFNAPLLTTISVTAVFKDLRQLEDYNCCAEFQDNLSFIDNEVKKRVTEKKIRYYRQFHSPVIPNTQQYE